MLFIHSYSSRKTRPMLATMQIEDGIVAIARSGPTRSDMDGTDATSRQ
jgi:hypothetical protein